MHHKGKKESEKEILRKEEKIINKVTKNFLQADSNADPQNQLELKVKASIHKSTSVNAENSSLKEVYIPSLW